MGFIKRFLAAAVFIACLMPGAAAFKDIKGLPLWKDSVIISYKAIFDETQSADFLAAHGVKNKGRQAVISAVESIYGLTDMKPDRISLPFKTYRISDPSGLTMTVAAIKQLPFIEYAEPNYIRRAFYTPIVNGPDDSYYHDGSSQWGYNMVRADLAYAANYNGSIISPTLNRTIIVAVLDTGIKGTHPDLSGYVGPGRNIIDNNSNADDTSAEGHGTFVSGIIAADTNNNTGIAGAAYSTGTAKVMLMPVRVLDANGEGNDSDIYEGLVWAADNGASVINMSFGGSQGGMTILNGVNYAASKGCVQAAAAGNTGVQEDFFPASYPEVISVGSLNSGNQKSYFSTYGKVDVSAPGEGIYSTTNSGGYNSGAGTSFAAPFVSALAAQVLLINNGITPQRVRDIIEHTADDVGPSGYDNQTGWGRINFYNALTNKISQSDISIKTYNWPNPFSPDRDVVTNITFVITRIQDMRIEIYDGGGNRVWSRDISKNEIRYGYNTFTWNGKNGNGAGVANGTYFYVIKAGSVIGKNKISVLY